MKEIGKIVLDEKAIVADPCYDAGEWCTADIKNVLPGQYKCIVDKRKTPGWGERVYEIVALHEAYEMPNKFELESSNIGVDSGQCGIYNYDYHEENAGDDVWYEKLCELTLREESAGTIDDAGFVSESGIGDGGYCAYTVRNEDGKVIAIKVIFLTDEDFKDEEKY